MGLTYCSLDTFRTSVVSADLKKNIVSWAGGMVRLPSRIVVFFSFACRFAKLGTSPQKI